MMKVKDNRSLIGNSLEAKLARLRDLTPIDSRLRKVVLRANRGIAFKASHPMSHLLVNNGRVEVGSYAPGYFNLLNLAGDRLGEICAAWIVEGSTRG